MMFLDLVRFYLTKFTSRLLSWLDFNVLQLYQSSTVCHPISITRTVLKHFTVLAIAI